MTLSTAVSGEIARHLGGSKLAARPSDNEDLVPDYPLLPTRRRFMESALRAVDRGAAGQLRSQLRVTMEAVSDVAGDPLGTVDSRRRGLRQQEEDMLNQGVLLHDLADRIAAVRDGSPSGETRARAVELVFLISQLDDSEGVRPTVDTLADLMVTDLNAGSATLRAELPDLLAPLVGSLLILDDHEYRLQSPTDAEWTRAFKNQRQALPDQHQRAGARPRGRHPPPARPGPVGGQGRPGRDRHPPQVRDPPRRGRPRAEPDRSGRVGAQRLGGQREPGPRRRRRAGPGQPDGHDLPAQAARGRAAECHRRLARGRDGDPDQPPPTTEEGQRARDAMASTAKRAEERMNGYAAEVVAAAQVLLGGGEVVSSGGLAGSVKEALGKAAVRKFPKFRDADHSGWPMVFKRAREGNQAALEAVGHKQDATSHPVTSQVLRPSSARPPRRGQPSTSTSTPSRSAGRRTPSTAPSPRWSSRRTSQASQGAQPVSATSLTDPAMTKLNYAAVARKLTFDQKMALKQLATKLGSPEQPAGRARGA